MNKKTRTEPKQEENTQRELPVKIKRVIIIVVMIATVIVTGYTGRNIDPAQVIDLMLGNQTTEQPQTEVEE